MKRLVIALVGKSVGVNWDGETTKVEMGAITLNAGGAVGAIHDALAKADEALAAGEEVQVLMLGCTLEKFHLGKRPKSVEIPARETSGDITLEDEDEL